jgi:hypothetical protein
MCTPPTYAGYVSCKYNGTCCVTYLLSIPATGRSHDGRVAIGNSTDALYHLPVCLIYSIRYNYSAGVFPSSLLA